MQLSQLIAFLSLSSAFVAGAPRRGREKCTTNTFTNGGFDTGSLAPWQTTASPGCTVSVKKGGANQTPYLAALKAFNQHSTPTQAVGDVQVYQIFDLCPKTNYTVQFLYWGGPNQDPNNQLLLYKQNGKGSTDIIYQAKGPFSADSTFAFPWFVTGASAKDTLLSFGFDSEADTPNTLFIDRISVIPSSEVCHGPFCQ